MTAGQEEEQSLQKVDGALMSRETREAEPGRNKNDQRTGKKGVMKKSKRGNKNLARKGKKGKKVGSKKSGRGNKNMARKGKKGGSKNSGRGNKNLARKGKKGKKGGSKKSGRGNKNLARKGKKGGSKKSGRGNKNLARKGKKGGIKKKQKSRKNKKGKNINKARLSGKNSTATCLAETCVDKAVEAMKLGKDKVSNFMAQYKRIVRKNKTGNSKSGKKGAFKSVLIRIINAGGGNGSALKCGNDANNAGAKQMANLTETLKKCSADIEKACDPKNIPQPNMTEVEPCNTAMTAFNTFTDSCGKKTGAEACTCFEGGDADQTALIKKCDLKDENAAVVKAITACKKAFGKCRKYEDDVASLLSSCSKDPNALKKKLKNLSENSKASGKALAKIKSMTARRRTNRAISDCTGFLSVTTTLITLISESPFAFTISTLATQVSVATVTCSADQITSLKAQQSAMEEAVASIDASIADVKATLLELTGSVPTDAEIEATEACEDAAACEGSPPGSEDSGSGSGSGSSSSSTGTSSISPGASSTSSGASSTSSGASSSSPGASSSPVASSPASTPVMTTGAGSRRAHFVQNMYKKLALQV